MPWWTETLWEIFLLFKEKKENTKRLVDITKENGKNRKRMLVIKYIYGIWGSWNVMDYWIKPFDHKSANLFKKENKLQHNFQINPSQKGKKVEIKFMSTSTQYFFL